MFSKEVFDLISNDQNALMNWLWVMMSFAMVIIPLTAGVITLFTKTYEQRQSEKKLAALHEERVLANTYNAKQMRDFVYAVIGPRLEGILLPRDDLLIAMLQQGMASVLTAREVSIVEYIWALKGEKKTLREIGQLHGISGVRVSTINRFNVRMKLRQWFRRQGIKIPMNYVRERTSL